MAESPASFLNDFMELPCISNAAEMSSVSGLPLNYSLQEVVYGQVVCQGSSTTSAVAIAVMLLVLHFGLLVAPIVCALWLPLPGAKSKAALVLGFAALSMASEGEIMLHFDARWLYFNLLPTIHNVFFYGGLTLGQALLAAGVKGWTNLTKLGLAASTIASGLQLYWTMGASGISDPIDQSIVTEYWYLWAVVFSGLASGLGVFIVVMPSKKRLQWAAAQVVWYALGVVFSMWMRTGEQAWHVPTASCFLQGFGVQVLWLVQTLGPGKVHAA